MKLYKKYTLVHNYNGDNYDNSSTKNNILLSIYICNISYNG